VCLGWGQHFEATISEQSAAASTASLLVSDRLLDRETAVKWVCRRLGIGDASAVLRALEEQDQPQPAPMTPPTPPSVGETNPNPAAEEPPSPASSARESDVEDA
jgi:hypothetical protein